MEDNNARAAEGKLTRKDVLRQLVSVMPDALKRLPPATTPAASAEGWKRMAVPRPSAHARVTVSSAPLLLPCMVISGLEKVMVWVS